ncbi:FliM/FliN family flagellar motor switch protein [Tatumella ptyseos]|uniref:FliM/FliN family flagellar motor switch protein n=1 Tax=Tatumella ptyseos TaxID=82987 RepID=UPI0026EE4CF5|nr:FliM/FliN family flagellar motor switch protein [Tatumella ptyseos]WKX26826.1 FliM/FliN family flagellar motor switch protein [Tatumella ptyseos]
MVCAKDTLKKLNIDKDDNVLSLAVSQLGKPWHKLAEHINKNYDNFDVSLSRYFLNKFRINTSLANIIFSIEENKKCHQLYSCAAGKIAFEIDRPLLLRLLNDFYGVTDNTELNETPEITQTELRLQERLGDEISRIFLTPEVVGLPLTLQSQPNQQHSHWAWSLSFQLRGYPQGVITLHFDHSLIDQILSGLLQETEPTPHTSLTKDQLERQLRRVPFSLTAQLASVEMTLEQLLALKVEDVLPVFLNESVPIVLGDETLFQAKVSEHQGQLVLSDFIDHYTR